MAQHQANSSSQRPYVLLDRDGTIIVDRNHLTDPDGVTLLPGAVAGLRRFQELGLGLVVLTNQSAIGRGYLAPQGLELIHQRMNDLLGEQGVELDAIYHCPHLPWDRCRCRKPRLGMVERAAADLGIEPTVCFMIGDRASDIELGRRAGATTFLVATGYGMEGTDDGNLGFERPQPDYSVEGLDEAAAIISAILEERR